MGEVELSSALAPLSRCRIASPLAGVPSMPRKRIIQTLSACRRAGYVASSSLGVPEQSGAAHRHEHVEHEHDMHGSMAGRSRADLRWWAHPSQAKRASARAPSNLAPCGSYQLRSAPQQRKLQLFNGRRDRDRSLNRGSARHSCDPHSISGPPSIGCRGAARAFDRGKPLFSEKLTVHVHNAYLAVQHVSCYNLYTLNPIQ